jgi:hypothetical protein
MAPQRIQNLHMRFPCEFGRGQPSEAKAGEGLFTQGTPSHPPIAGAMGPALSHFVGEGLYTKHPPGGSREGLRRGKTEPLGGSS